MLYPQSIPERFASPFPLSCTKSDTLLQNKGSFVQGHLSGLWSSKYSSSARFSPSLHGTHTIEFSTAGDALLWSCTAKKMPRSPFSPEILLLGVIAPGEDQGLFSPIFYTIKRGQPWANYCNAFYNDWTAFILPWTLNSNGNNLQFTTFMRGNFRIATVWWLK